MNTSKSTNVEEIGLIMHSLLNNYSPNEDVKIIRELAAKRNQHLEDNRIEKEKLSQQLIERKQVLDDLKNEIETKTVPEEKFQQQKQQLQESRRKVMEEIKEFQKQILELDTVCLELVKEKNKTRKDISEIEQILIEEPRKKKAVETMLESVTNIKINTDNTDSNLITGFVSKKDTRTLLPFHFETSDPFKLANDLWSLI